MNYIKLVDSLVNAIIGILNIIGSTQKVSDIITARIAAGRTEWTDEERAEIQADLDMARERAEELVRRGAAPGGETTV